MMRQTMVDLKLSNGFTIPKGNLIAFPNTRFDMSAATEKSPDPDEFDGFRYAKLRAIPGQESKHQLIGPGSDSLTWGYGSHVCPGRAFAATELKVILIHLLENFEIKLKDGDKRPKNSSQDFQIMPHPEATIMLTPRVK
jgi:cytochrome P450